MTPHGQPSRAILAAVLIVGLASDAPDLEPLVELLVEVDDTAVQLDVLLGMHDGLRGRKSVPMPRGWPACYARLSASANPEVREVATLLSLLFGDRQALEQLRATIMDGRASEEERQTALESLVQHRASDLAPSLLALLEDPSMRRAALRGLAAYGDPSIPAAVLERYPDYDDDAKQDAIQTLASRPSYALALLQAVADSVVARRDISTFTARQLENLQDKQVTRRLHEVWGQIRETSVDKQRLIARYKHLLSPEYLRTADLGRGRLAYERTCGKCHVLYGVGGRIGPDLTGSNRADLDYLLQNIIDPSAAIGSDYELFTLVTGNGRIVTGIIAQRTDHSLTVQTVNERVIVPREDIQLESTSQVSMMPEGQLEEMSDEEARDLVAYLASTSQVPLPAEGGE